MPINQLLHDHQLAKLHAQEAQSREARETYLGLVDYYAKRIAAWRRSSGLPLAGWPRGDGMEGAPR